MKKAIILSALGFTFYLCYSAYAKFRSTLLNSEKLLADNGKASVGDSFASNNDMIKTRLNIQDGVGGSGFFDSKE